MTLASIPSPQISTFEIGPLTIHIYALCILAGIIGARVYHIVTTPEQIGRAHV